MELIRNGGELKYPFGFQFFNFTIAKLGEDLHFLVHLEEIYCISFPSVEVGEDSGFKGAVNPFQVLVCVVQELCKVLNVFGSAY